MGSAEFVTPLQWISLGKNRNCPGVHSPELQVFPGEHPIHDPNHHRSIDQWNNAIK